MAGSPGWATGDVVLNEAWIPAWRAHFLELTAVRHIGLEERLVWQLIGRSRIGGHQTVIDEHRRVACIEVVECPSRHRGR
ncbi:MAG: hypothetical protein FJ284_08795 [Planctomycetes bacterium]|nr:hypothetical protein [Planctomycetota bacterium]